jgi:hypothetical protein
VVAQLFKLSQICKGDFMVNDISTSQFSILGTCKPLCSKALVSSVPLKFSNPRFMIIKEVDYVWDASSEGVTLRYNGIIQDDLDNDFVELAI